MIVSSFDYALDVSIAKRQIKGLVTLLEFSNGIKVLFATLIEKTVLLTLEWDIMVLLTGNFVP